MIDTPQEAAIGDKAARELFAYEEGKILASTFGYQQEKIKRLQASNSELLEALKDAKTILRYGDLYEKISAVIAKAEGKA